MLVASNGYTDETLPAALGGRLLPALTRIIVTRPISDNELKAQGWTRTDPTYDTRNLLHYFRLLPDNRFMFGGRGGTDASPEGMKAIQLSLRANFEKFFPRLAHVETEYSWGGLVCLTSSRLPFAGPIDGMDNVFGAFGWHGNGVAMASYAANRSGRCDGRCHATLRRAACHDAVAARAFRFTILAGSVSQGGLSGLWCGGQMALVFVYEGR